MLVVTPILLPLPLRMGSVNAYLLYSEDAFALVDTGGSNARAALLDELERSHCWPGRLRLIVLTHGDFDHSGNAAYLRKVFDAPVAMGAGDAGMVERGDMFVNRKQPNTLTRRLIPLFTGFGRDERFTPDLTLAEGDSLSGYGLQATILELPGHSTGSIGLLTSRGGLFCGDLLDNLQKPALNRLIDDRQAALASLARLADLDLAIVYPGHGMPFAKEMCTEFPVSP